MNKKIGKISPRMRWILIALVTVIVLLLLVRQARAEKVHPVEPWVVVSEEAPAANVLDFLCESDILTSND